MVDLGDQIVDALRHVAPALVGLEDLAVERADALALLGELVPEGLVLALQAPVTLGQLLDGALEALDVERACACFRDVRNGGTPNWGILPGTRRTRQASAPKDHAASSRERGPR